MLTAIFKMRIRKVLLKMKIEVSITSKLSKWKIPKKNFFLYLIQKKTIFKRNFPGDTDKVEYKGIHFLKYMVIESIFSTYKIHWINVIKNFC